MLLCFRFWFGRQVKWMMKGSGKEISKARRLEASFWLLNWIDVLIASVVLEVFVDFRLVPLSLHFFFFFL